MSHVAGTAVRTSVICYTDSLKQNHDPALMNVFLLEFVSMQNKL